MRVVWRKERWKKAFENAKTEAAASFKNDGIYMEKICGRASSHRDTGCRWTSLAMSAI
jgi:acetyl/propionyl-CoA carboxylase alpha subunit